MKTEREAFEQDLVAHMAALLDFARPYVGLLGGADRDAFLNAALAAAWNTREQFNPQKASMLQWWKQCLDRAAFTRREWRLVRQDRTDIVKAKDLGRTL